MGRQFLVFLQATLLLFLRKLMGFDIWTVVFHCKYCIIFFPGGKFRPNENEKREHLFYFFFAILRAFHMSLYRFPLAAIIQHLYTCLKTSGNFPIKAQPIPFETTYTIFAKLAVSHREIQSFQVQQQTH